MKLTTQLLMRYIMHVYFQCNFYHQYDALMPESLLNDEFRFLCDAISDTEILKSSHFEPTDCPGTDWSCTRQKKLQHGY